MGNKMKERTVIVYETETGRTLEHTKVNLEGMRSISGFLKGEWNLEAFADCFGGKNKLGDIDASIEIDGHHLAIEFKEHEKSMNQGQLVKAIRMAKYCNTTTIFVFGKTNEPRKMIKISPNHLNGKLESVNNKQLNKLFKKWYQYAKRTNVDTKQELNSDWNTAKKVLKDIEKNGSI